VCVCGGGAEYVYPAGWLQDQRIALRNAERTQRVLDPLSRSESLSRSRRFKVDPSHAPGLHSTRLKGRMLSSLEEEWTAEPLYNELFDANRIDYGTGRESSSRRRFTTPTQSR
jgi:hypothetical protein